MSGSGPKPEAFFSVRLSASAGCGHWSARGSAQVKRAPAAVPRAIPHVPIGAWLLPFGVLPGALGRAEAHEQAGGSPVFCMRRREFIALVGGAAVAWPLGTGAQQMTTKTNVPTIGWVVTGSPSSVPPFTGGIRDGLTAAGYVEGQNIRIEYRWAEGNVSRLAELARDLVHQQVDVILAGGSVGAEAAKRATSIIPIVAAGVGDPRETPI